MSLELYERFAESRGDVALVDTASGREFTYGQVWALAVASAEILKQRGAVRGKPVALGLSNGPEFVCCVLGCLIGGYIAVPINQELSENDIAGILKAAAPSLVLNGPLDEVFEGEKRDRILGDDSLVGSMPVALKGDEVCAIFFTSGTTGQPKGVRQTLQAMVGNVQAFNELVGLGPNTRMYHVLPMAYMAGFLNTVLSPLMAGGSVVIGPRFAPQGGLDFWSKPRTYNANTMWLTPTIAATLQRLARDPEAARTAASGFRQIFCGTAPLHTALRNSFQQTFGIPLQESYGTSELLLISAQTGESAASFEDVGELLEGVQLDTLEDGEGNLELVVDSPFACQGYLTSEGFRDVDRSSDGLVRTGDVGQLTNGRLSITGRLKDLIIRGGVNVSPIAIENALADLPGVSNVAVVGLPHEFWGESIVVCLEVLTGADHDGLKRQVRALSRERLGAAQRPDRVEIYNEFPRAVTGKIQKNVIRAGLAA